MDFQVVKKTQDLKKVGFMDISEKNVKKKIFGKKNTENEFQYCPRV